jgi:excisionase family DNA binding protein
MMRECECLVAAAIATFAHAIASHAAYALLSVRSSKASQAFATIRDKAGGDSSASQLFAPFTEDSADRLRTLLTVSEVAAYLRVSTATWYELCAGGKLPHVRVFNAIRIAPCDLQAFVRHG